MATDNVSARGILKSIDWITILLFLVIIILGWFSVLGATYIFGDTRSFSSMTGYTTPSPILSTPS